MKIDFKEKKEQVTNWVKENKGVIALGLGTTALVVITMIFAGRKMEEAHIIDLTLEPIEESEPEREILMTFSDEATGEVLWKERCCEEFLDDSKYSGMQFAEVRQLNGIEEA